MRNESNRATANEKTLTENLNNEIQRAKESEESIISNLDDQINKTEDFKTKVTNNLNDEVKRAISSENIINNNVIAESDRAKSAEKILTDDISNEINRATKKEDDLESDLNSNKPNWNDAYNKRHIHNNKAILDGLGKSTNGDLIFEGSKIVSTTVNGLTDDVAIEGGNNITIIKSGNKIVVSAAGGQDKIVTNTPINISATDWILDATVTPNVYTAIIQHNLNDSNIIIGVYNGTQKLELVEITIKDTNSIILSNCEAIDCKVVINSSGQPTKVIDNLDSNESNQALSAKQGKILKTLINSVEGGVAIGTTLADAKPISLFLKIID